MTNELLIDCMVLIFGTLGYYGLYEFIVMVERNK